jgi:hypothetical protein
MQKAWSTKGTVNNTAQQLLSAHKHVPLLWLLWKLVAPVYWTDAIQHSVMYRPIVNNDSFCQLSKHIPLSTNTRATIELLLETGCFYMVHAEML